MILRIQCTFPEEFKSEEGDKSGTEEDKNRANSIIRHPRT